MELGCHIVAEIDANAKIGKEAQPDDPNEATENGKIMLDMIKRNYLIVANTLPCCKGLITRQRVLENGTEEKAVLVD